MRQTYGRYAGRKFSSKFILSQINFYTVKSLETAKPMRLLELLPFPLFHQSGNDGSLVSLVSARQKSKLRVPSRTNWNTKGSLNYCDGTLSNRPTCGEGTYYILLDTSCQSCMEEKVVKSSCHFLLNWPSNARLWWKHSHSFGEPGEVAAWYYPLWQIYVRIKALRPSKRF